MFKHLVPPIFRELFLNAPHLIFKMIPWTDVLSEFKTMAKQLKLNEEAMALQDKLNGQFKKRLVIDLHSTLKKTDLYPAGTELGETLLWLYFKLVLNQESVFFDLRLSTFFKEGSTVYWRPRPFWFTFSPQFSKGLRDLYAGFYLDNEQQFERGLMACKILRPSTTEAVKSKIVKLFRAHFGQANHQPISFSLNQFTSSFTEIFQYMLSEKMSLSLDFFRLGIVLTALYSGLQECGGAYDVKQIYLDAVAKTGPKFMAQAPMNEKGQGKLKHKQR